jgi:uncharacterized membrane protein
MKARRFILWVVLAAYAVMWCGGVVGQVLTGGPPAGAAWASGVFLLLAGLIVVLTSRPAELAGLAAAALLGLAAEVVGVRYGFPFSPYCYTEVLQPQFLAVPVVMACAWMVLVAYVRQMLKGFGLPARVEVVVAAAWMTAIDLVIDPLAANQLGYWRWAGAGRYYGIPWQNFAGWFAVSLLIFGLVRQRWRPNPWARFTGLSIVLFFAAIALASGLRLAALIGLGLCALHFALPRSSPVFPASSAPPGRQLTSRPDRL